MFSKFSIFLGHHRRADDQSWRARGDIRIGPHHFDPNQPRIPKGQSHAGEWTRINSPETGGFGFGPFIQLAASGKPPNLRSKPNRLGQKLIEEHRKKNARHDMLGEVPEPRNSVVATTNLDGKQIFGAHAHHHTFRSEDRVRADEMRALLIRKYPEVMKLRNIGQMPNDALYHAEANVLLRAAKENGGSLVGKTLEIDIDDVMCESCKKVLPLLVRELGSPTVTFVDSTGAKYLVANGRLNLKKIEGRRD